MTSSSACIVTLTGRVECRREASGPLRLTLVGQSADRAQTVWLAFHGEAPPDLPPVLDGAVVQRAASQEYTIASGDRRWSVSAASVHVHRDVAAAFYAAVPPRRVRLLKRLLWRIALAAAASAAGRYWLSRRSRVKLSSE